MKIDLVTRVALVVIAGCLVLLTAKSFLPAPAVASQKEIHRVDLVRIDGIVNVNLDRVGGYIISKKELLDRYR